MTPSRTAPPPTPRDASANPIPLGPSDPVDPLVLARVPLRRGSSGAGDPSCRRGLPTAALRHRTGVPARREPLPRPGSADRLTDTAGRARGRHPPTRARVAPGEASPVPPRRRTEAGPRPRATPPRLRRAPRRGAGAWWRAWWRSSPWWPCWPEQDSVMSYGPRRPPPAPRKAPVTPGGTTSPYGSGSERRPMAPGSAEQRLRRIGLRLQLRRELVHRRRRPVGRLRHRRQGRPGPGGHQHQSELRG